MKQKLSLCCALIHHPRLLLLDEPTFGVDPISRRDLWLILHEMVAEGVTVIVTTSYLDEAERCDRVALLDHGRVLALDRPTALQQALRGQVFAVRAADPVRARDAIRATPAVRRAVLFGEAVHVVMEEGGSFEATLGALAAAGIVVRDAGAVEPSMEDVFIDRVGRAAEASLV